jgi:hypothetical protein
MISIIKSFFLIVIGKETGGEYSFFDLQYFSKAAVACLFNNPRN